MPSPDATPLPDIAPLRLRQLLDALCGTVLFIALASIAAGEIAVAVVLAAAALLFGGAAWLVRRGRTVTAAQIMLATLVLLMAALLYVAQGLRDEAILGLPAIMVFAAMFTTGRTFIAIFAALVLTLVLLAAGNILGWHVQRPDPVSWYTLLNAVTILAMSSYFIWRIASDLRTAMARLGTENERIRESHARIDALAHHDSLTGLPNRLLARDRFEQALALARRGETSVALLFLDLDNFKDVNDTLGHAAGDLLLCEVALRLAGAVRASDTISRHGGDEFLIVLAGIGREQEAGAAAAKVMAALAAPFHLTGLALPCSCSLGIATFPKDGDDFDTLLKHADMAMYHAKDAGRNTFSFYDVAINAGVLEHLQLIAGIREALENRQFTLHYQPQYELAGERIVGAEALIRWRHPELGMVPPTKFIAVAERAGLINAIGTWVLNEACRQARAWQDAGLDGLVIAVNLSPAQFKRGDIEQEVVGALAAADLAPSSIELELTESLLIAEGSHLSQLLGRLRAMGVHLAIDDFGTGYSNLGYLRRFQVARLKIDQSFIRRMTHDAHDAGIVAAIVQMAHSLKLEVVAEGIEDAQTLAKLIELGCEFGQGFHWSPAIPPAEFYAFVTQARNGRL
jgi:diguanylate cyclase (GGDEF)-like protein